MMPCRADAVTAACHGAIFGTVSERDGRLSSVILGPGATFEEQLRNAAVQQTWIGGKQVFVRK